MTLPLRVLLVNNSENESLSIIKELEEAGYTVQSLHVDSAQKLTAALKKQTWDIILSGNDTPNFNGLQVLRTSHNINSEIPVVIITENLSVDEAGILVQAGASSCIPKKELTRLMPIVKRELKNAKIRREFKSAELQIITQSKLASESPDPILRVSLDGVIRYHNKASFPLLLHWQVSLGKALPEKWQKIIKEVYESGKNKTAEIEYIEKKFLLNIVPVKGADYVNIYALDITGLKNAEAKIKNSEAFLNNIIDQTPNALWISDDKGTLIRMNRALRNLLQLTDERIVGKYNVFKDEQVKEQGFLPLVESVFKEGKTVDFTIEYNTEKEKQFASPTKATHRIIDIIMSPVLDEKGRLLNVICQEKDITEQEKVKIALRESEEKYRSLFENSSDAILLTIPDGTILSANPAAERMFGCSEAEIYRVGRNGIIDVTDPRLAEALKKRELTGKFEGELTFIRKDRSKFPGEITSTIFTDSDGNKRTSMIIRDISERKKNVEKLTESETRFRELFDNIKTCVAVYEAVDNGNNFIITDFNKAAERAEKIHKQDVIGKLITNAFPGVKDFGILEALQRVWRTGKPEHLPISFYKDRRITGWRENYIYRLPSGTIVASYEDVTERKQAEQALLESENKYHNLVERANDSICIIQDGKIVYANHSLTQIWGGSMEELIGKDFTDFVHPDSLEMLITNYQLRIVGKEVPSIYEVFLQDKSGKKLTVELNAGIIYYQEKPADMVIIRDITGRKEAEQRLADNERTLRAAQSLGKIGSWETNIKTGQITWSDELYELYERDKTLGPASSAEMDSYLTREDSKKIHEAVQIALETGQIFRTDVTAHLPNGKTVYQSHTFSPVKGEDGKITKFMGIVQDITERKLAEEQVGFQAQLLDNATEFIHVTDYDGNFLYINKAGALKGGFTPDELYREGLHPEELYRMRARKEELLQKGELTYETALYLKNGGVIPIETHATAINIGGKDYVLNVSRDITERKTAEEQIRLQAQLLDSSIDPVFVHDSQNRIIYMNESALLLYGYSRNELLNRNIDILVAEEKLKSVPANLQKVIAEGEISFETLHKRKNGTIIPVEIHSRTIKRGGRTLILTVVRDISERKRAIQQLEENTQRLKEAQTLGKIASYEVDVTTTRGIWSEEMYNLFERDKTLPAPDIEEIKVYFTPEEYEKYQMITRTAVGENRKAEGDVIARLPSGKTPVFHISVRSLRDVKGKVTRTFGTIQDITERKKAEDDLQKSYTRLSKILDGIISAIAATIEIRDPYTSGHQQQVSKLAGAIAEELGLPEATTNAIYTAGVIHDIGKIGIPADILSKPGKLNQIEYSLIKAHAQIGADVLKNIDFPFPIARWVLEHHERLDGTGYPAGLKNGEISREAKILAVADVVESMVSHRPYRPALGIDAALDEIKKNKGKLYDPEVVDACVKLFKEKDFKLS